MVNNRRIIGDVIDKKILNHLTNESNMLRYVTIKWYVLTISTYNKYISFNCYISDKGTFQTINGDSEPKFAQM